MVRWVLVRRSMWSLHPVRRSHTRAVARFLVLTQSRSPGLYGSHSLIRVAQPLRYDPFQAAGTDGVEESLSVP